MLRATAVCTCHIEPERVHTESHAATRNEGMTTAAGGNARLLHAQRDDGVHWEGGGGGGGGGGGFIDCNKE